MPLNNPLPAFKAFSPNHFLATPQLAQLIEGLGILTKVLVNLACKHIAKANQLLVLVPLRDLDERCAMRCRLLPILGGPGELHPNPVLKRFEPGVCLVPSHPLLRLPEESNSCLLVALPATKERGRQEPERVAGNAVAFEQVHRLAGFGQSGVTILVKCHSVERWDSSCLISLGRPSHCFDTHLAQDWLKGARLGP